MARFLGLLFLLAQLSLQQKDPLKDFCRRFGSQSAVIDEKLYIDGGLTNWNPISQNPRNNSNTWLLWHDLTKSPDLIGVPPLYANLSKNASIPSVSGGSFWADEVNKRIFLYGGDYLDITPNQPEVLSYDAVYNEWQSEGRLGLSIGSVAWGGSVGVSELGRGYVLGGWMSNTSMPGWTGGRIATSYLLQYDMISGDWRNSTGPNSIPKAEGTLQYLPIGNTGALIYFGGGIAPYGNDTLVELPMSTIYLYDIKSSQWYEQQAGGDVPASRRRFCAGAGWIADRSSYNIYLYGGLGFGSNFTGFDDVYILSLPSFKWIKYWEGDNREKPHHSLTCNVVHDGQMIIIGGSFPLTESCDSPSTWGVHNLDMGEVSGYPWVEYRLNITTYVVPPAVLAVIGGSSIGGATITAPVEGFRNFDLGIFFRQRAAIISRTPTRLIPTETSVPTPFSMAPSASTKRLGAGAIAGVSVAGTSVLFALIIGIWYFIRRHRQLQQNLDGSSNSQDYRPPPPPSTRQYSNSTYPPTSPYSPTSPNIPFPAPSYQLEAEPLPVELSATKTHEIIEIDHPKKHDGFPFHSPMVGSQEGDMSPQSYGNSPSTTYSSGYSGMPSPGTSSNRGNFPPDVGRLGGGGGSVSSNGRRHGSGGTELVSPQLTISTIEIPPERPKFQNQTYYSP